MRHKYIKIKLHGGSTYVQPANALADALDGDLDGVDVGDEITMTFAPIDITDEEYERLPEFTGH